MIIYTGAVYWRCHRRIIADWLLSRGYDVINICGADRVDDPARYRSGVVRFNDLKNGWCFVPSVSLLTGRLSQNIVVP